MTIQKNLTADTHLNTSHASVSDEGFILNIIKQHPTILELANLLNLKSYNGLKMLYSKLKIASEFNNRYCYLFGNKNKESLTISETIDAFFSVFKALEKKEIPQEYKKEILFCHIFRDEIIQRQGFPLIAKNWIKPLSKWISDKRCLEIMAGKGVLSYALKQEGVNIIPTDNFSWENFINNNTWCDVENIDAIKAIEKYGKTIDIIIMSWCYMDETGYKCLLKMREVNPNCKMIYIGEWAGGCTASDSFFESLTEIHDDSFEEISLLFPKWHTIHDNIYLIK